LSGFELIARLVEALSWPLAVAFIAVVLRARLRDVLGAFTKRISALTKVKAFGAGLEFDGPAADAVERVLADSATPLPTREVLAAAVREEIDRRGIPTPSAPYSDHPNRQQALSIRADGILYEAEVVRALKFIVAADSIETEVMVGGRQIDALIRTDTRDRSSLSTAVVVEITRRPTIKKIWQDVSKIADLPQPGGFLYIVPSEGLPLDGIIEEFKHAIDQLGIKNAHLAAFDVLGDPSLSNLAIAVHAATTSVRPTAPSD